ncbi:hypothetical protein T4E_6971, partial [Trichinella pseudospiralis]
MTNATYGERYHSAGYCDEASVKMPCFQRYCCYVEAVETDQSSFSLVAVTGCLRRIGSFPKSAFTTDQHTIFAIYIHLQPAGKQARTSACVDVVARACKSRPDNRISGQRNDAGALWPGSWQNSADKHSGRLNAFQLPRAGQILDQRCWQEEGEEVALDCVHYVHCPAEKAMHISLFCVSGVKSYLASAPT